MNNPDPNSIWEHRRNRLKMSSSYGFIIIYHYEENQNLSITPLEFHYYLIFLLLIFSYSTLLQIKSPILLLISNLVNYSWKEPSSLIIIAKLNHWLELSQLDRHRETKYFASKNQDMIWDDIWKRFVANFIPINRYKSI